MADLERVVDFESETYSRYFDFRPTWEIATAGSLEAARRRLASAS